MNKGIEGKGRRHRGTKGLSCVAAGEEGRRIKLKNHVHLRSRYAGKGVVLKIE